eukprot:gene5533-7650_t
MILLNSSFKSTALWSIQQHFFRYINFKSKRFPKRFILARHGESSGNVSSNLYCEIPDWKIPLTDKGFTQSHNIGERIKNVIGNDCVCIYWSPYQRTQETVKQIAAQINTNKLLFNSEEPHLSEQQFGNLENCEDIIKFRKERLNYGMFYYRFPQGESGLDVYNRSTLFLKKLRYDLDNDESIIEDDFNNMTIIIVSHGITIRAIVMILLHLKVVDFEQSYNPQNGDIIILNRVHNESTKMPFFQLDENSKIILNLLNEPRVT